MFSHLPTRLQRAIRYFKPCLHIKLRIVLGLLALSFEVFINLLSYDLDWRPVKSSVGNYPCNPATYPLEYDFTLGILFKWFICGEMYPGE
jgi:hypothetical protein